MSSRPSLAQAYGQEPFRKSSDKAFAQASAQAPSPNQLLRGAARKYPRPSAYATTTSYALPSTTRTSPPQDAIPGQDRRPSGSFIVEVPPQLPSQIPTQENIPPLRQLASRLAPKRDHVIRARQVKQQESTSKEKPKHTRAPTQRGVQEPGHKFAGKVIDRLGEALAQVTAHTVTGQPPRRYSQALRRTSSSPDPDRKASLLPIRVTDRSSTGYPTGLATRRPIRATSNLLSRQTESTTTQGNVRRPVETPTPPLTTTSLDISLAANQEVIVRAGQQSLSLRNIAGNLVLKVEDTWRLLDDLVSIRTEFKQSSD